MASRVQLTKESLLSKIRFAGLFLEVRLRMLVIGTIVKKRRLRSLFLLLIGLFVFGSPRHLLAAEGKWFWSKLGERIQISQNSISTGDNVTPSIASSASKNLTDPLYLAVWARQTTTGFDIVGARVGRDGKILGEGDGEISICAAVNDQMYPVVVWDGDHFLVVWQDHRSGKRWEIYGARVAPDGTVDDRDGKLLSKSAYDQIGPAVAWSGESYLLAWQGKRTSKIWNIYYTELSKDLDPAFEKPRLISSSSKDQSSPSVSFDGKNFMVVWQQKDKGNNFDVYGTSVMRDQEPGNVEVIQINDSGPSTSSWLPAVSWNGKNYLVVWTDLVEKGKWRIYGRRVNRDGELLDPVAVGIQTGGANKAFPAILWDGNQHLLVWEEDPGNYFGIYGASVDTEDWSFSSEAVRITSGQSEEKASLPALSIIWNEVLVLWQGKDGEGRWQIFGQKLMKMLFGS